MKLLAIGLATLAFVGLVWWLARPATEVRPRPELDGALPVAPLETGATKVPADRAPTTRTPKVLPSGEENEALSIFLLAVEGPSSQAAKVPGVELVVGTGREPGRPTWKVGDARKAALVVTDSEGAAATTIPRSELADDRVIWAMVTTPGFQQIQAWKPVPGEGALSLQVVARKGGTIRGAVENEARERVSEARVTLLTDHPQEGGEIVSIDMVASDQNGEFALHFFNPGVHHVQAAASGAGSGSLRDLALNGPDLPQDLLVVVSGSGVLAGVLRDPEGDPVRAYPLLVVPADLGRLPGPRDLHANEWSGGLYADGLRTDDEGGFRAAGLKPGAYYFMGSTLPAYPPEELHDEPILTDEENIELVVGVYRLELTAFDSNGEQVTLPTAPHQPMFPSPGNWPRAFVQESDGRGGPLEPREFSTPLPDATPEGTVVFTVRPDQHYLVGVVGPRRFAAAEVFIPRTRHLTTHEVRLSAARDPAELVVRVLLPGGEPMRSIVQLYVHDFESGRLVSRSRVPNTGPTWRTYVPAGRYVVRVEAEPVKTHLSSSRVAEYAPDETTVELLPGRTTEVDLQLRGSGRLELTLDVLAPDLHPSFWRQEEIQSYWNLGERFQSVFREALGGRTVELVSSEGGPPLRTTFQFPLPAESPFPRLDARWIYPQCTALSLTPIAPGEYRLLVDGLPERTVTIRDGETTQVSLR